MHRRFILTATTLLILGTLLVSFSFRSRRSAESTLTRQTALACKSASKIAHRRIVYMKERVERGVTFSDMLESLGADSGTVSKMVACAEPIFNFRGLSVGHALAVGWSPNGNICAVRYQIDDEHLLSIKPSGSAFHAEIEKLPSHTITRVVRGQVRDSLFNAVTDSGERPELAMRLAKIFAYDLDFYTDPQPGDTFRVLVEKKIALNGRVLGYGRILAAQYVNAGRAYRAVLFHDSQGAPAYFSPDGKPLRKAFLRSPLRYAAPITSHFSRHRFHPILKIYRPHLGTDYGARIGTPVQAVASGRVVYAGWRGEAGRAICLHHARGYRTYYFHLSRIFVHAGESVKQGEEIGLVGETGLATGPHLDFRVQRHGVFLNFEKIHLPPAAPVARSQWKQFAMLCNQRLRRLSSGQVTLARARTPTHASSNASANGVRVP